MGLMSLSSETKGSVLGPYSRYDSLASWNFHTARHVVAALAFGGSHCRAWKTHAMAGVIAHSRAIVSSANARILVTLISTAFSDHPE
jgi:hypothetical protein